jgi:hypothetical protein
MYTHIQKLRNDGPSAYIQFGDRPYASSPLEPRKPPARQARLESKTHFFNRQFLGYALSLRSRTPQRLPTTEFRMPLFNDVERLIRANLAEVSRKRKPRVVVIGVLTETHLLEIDEHPQRRNFAPIEVVIVFAEGTFTRAASRETATASTMS